jgi:hypothetical protein
MPNRSGTSLRITNRVMDVLVPLSEFGIAGRLNCSIFNGSRDQT